MTNINPLHVSAPSPRTSDGWIHWNKLHNTTIHFLCLVINPLLHYTTLRYSFSFTAVFSHMYTASLSYKLGSSSQVTLAKEN